MSAVGTRTIAATVFLDALRKKVLYVLLLFAGALVLAIPALPSSGVGVRVDLFRDLSLGLTSLFGVVIGVALGVNQIPGEVERRTVYNVLSKPVRRVAFVAGKLLGLLMTMAAVVAVMSTITFLATALYFKTADPALFVAGWAIFLEVAVVSGFVVMVSTFATPPVTATLTVVFYFVGHVKNAYLAPALEQSGIALLPARAAYYVVPGLESYNVNGLVAHGLPVPLYQLGLATVSGVLFAAVFFVIGAAVFQRKDL